jgi:uncharacterized membrane protein
MFALRNQVAILALVGVTMLPAVSRADTLQGQPIYAQNNTCHPIWVAAQYAPPGTTAYITQGYWEVEPGQRVLIFYNNTQYIYFYARDEQGTQWNGNDASGVVNGETVNMFQEDTGTGYDPWTMTFNP